MFSTLVWLGLSTGLSTGALVFAVLAWRSVKAHEPKRRVGVLECQLADLEYVIASHASTLKRLNARIGMRDARAKREEPEPSEAAVTSLSPLAGETTAQWKARVRPILQTRKLDG